jgi:hypothetical protein
MSMANDIGGLLTNGGSNGIFGSMNVGTSQGASSYASTGSASGQNNSGINLGLGTDQLLQTGLSALSQTVPVWTSSLLGQQTQNQLSSPTYSGLGTQPGLTSGAGTTLPGPQPPGGTPTNTALSTSTLLLIGAVVVVFFLMMKE